MSHKKSVLPKRHKEAVEEADAGIDANIKRFNAWVNELTDDKIMKDRTLRTLWVQYLDKNDLDECAGFVNDVVVSGKRNLTALQRYIPDCAPTQVNISHAKATKLAEFIQNGGDPTDAGQWATIEKAVAVYLEMDGHAAGKFLPSSGGRPA